MSGDLVRYSVSGNIAEIMLDRPPVNALSMDLIDALLAALAKVRDDEAVRAVIIGSAHKVFCAGLDLDIVRGKPGIETKKFLERLYFALNDTQYRMGKPTIAAVDGAVRAGGMTIAIRTAGDPLSVARPAVAAIRSIDETQPVENIKRDTDRDNFMSSAQAKEYGIIDEVLITAKKKPDEKK